MLSVCIKFPCHNGFINSSLCYQRLAPHQGPYIKDVRTEGGRGGLRIARFCGQIVLIGCVKCGQRGEGGLKIPKILRTSFMYGPQGRFELYILSSACGRCFVCFVLNLISMQGPKTEHMKHIIPQADE